MSTPVKFKIRTIIANCDADTERKSLLETHVGTLSEEDLVQLLVVFEREPRAIGLYADYLKALQGRTQPLSPRELEETLTPILGTLT